MMLHSYARYWPAKHKHKVVPLNNISLFYCIAVMGMNEMFLHYGVVLQSSP